MKSDYYHGLLSDVSLGFVSLNFSRIHATWLVIISLSVGVHRHPNWPGCNGSPPP
jgi:hypothetical protein